MPTKVKLRPTVKATPKSTTVKKSNPTPTPSPSASSAFSGIQSGGGSSASPGRALGSAPLASGSASGSIYPTSSINLGGGGPSGSASGYVPGASPFAGLAGSAAAPAAPVTIKDIDWFNQDSQFRQEAAGLQSDLADQLSQLLYARGQGYQQIDDARRDWTQSRQDAQTSTGEDFAARGLLSSGLYKSALDQMLQEFEKSQGQINDTEQDLQQQYGARDSLVGGIDRGKLFDSNYAGLADVYGLLGQNGVQAGNKYTQALAALMAGSAGRSTDTVLKTLNW